ncbi:MAG: 2Fe-2S ferredoxin [Hydrocarboniphaga sp.]|uniref:2Fe-2S iron-sulfur cluster-binding protein n=1 Tax=Hydrocarboniphaga sp. TaxID=2033016 RepID=UPI00262745ED|nr:2Fe-2S iron-sulfur cluster-binding protein [Hydrocarboniphaga sp.]MDB5972188.1 2Fe-2S ferredoxin [Hydrocarboniphaga sp.]
MRGIRVVLIQNDGVARTIDNAAIGVSLMEVGRAEGVDGILGDCGGGCSCATCHVYVDAEWQQRVGPPDDVEIATLDMVSHLQQSNSRLCCQIVLTPELDGLKVTVAPAE